MTDSTQASAPETPTSAAADVQSGAPAVAPVTEQAPATPEAPAAATAEAPGQPATPVEYTDFAVPEGLEMDAEVLTNFKGIAKELGIPQEGVKHYEHLC